MVKTVVKLRPMARKFVYLVRLSDVFERIPDADILDCFQKPKRAKCSKTSQRIS